MAAFGSSSSEDIDRHVLRRYDILQKLGKGAYGVVWRVESKKSREKLALKKIFDAFQNATDAQRTYREILYLWEMAEHPYVIDLRKVIRADNDRDIYLVFENMETDLAAAIKMDILHDIHKQYITWQALCALKCARRSACGTLACERNSHLRSHLRSVAITQVYAFCEARAPRHEASKFAAQLRLPDESGRLWPCTLSQG